jgi:hypothetical protein
MGFVQLRRAEGAVMKRVSRSIAVLAVAVQFSCPAPASATPVTDLSITGTEFQIDGTDTYPGTAVQGLLLSSRMINAVFNDRNPGTVSNWAYPDTGEWDPARNTNEFIQAMPTYASEGLNMVTVGLQGGMPWSAGYSGPRTEKVSGFKSTGTLKVLWMNRLAQVIEAAEANGIVVTVSLFYVWQDQRLATDAEVEAAAKAVIDWINVRGYTNVLLEVCNECNLSGFDHANLQPQDGLASLLAELNAYAQIPVSASVTGSYEVPDALISAEDYVTLHCNAQTAEGVTSMVTAMRLRTAKPIVLNECGSDIGKMDAAIAAGASWGFYDQGNGSYTADGSGFQSMPTRWGIGSAAEQAFFDRVAALT